jgi:hypothetical protein
MKLTVNKTNVTPAGGSYPYGDVKDNTGPNDGTPVNNELLADYVQFFERMMSESGITPNNLPDNSTNGFQLFEALKEVVKPYKVYSALISQTGTSDPTLTVLTDEITGTIVWTRLSTGVYVGTLTGAFLIAKTFATLQRNADEVNAITRIDNNKLYVTTNSTPGGTSVDGSLSSTPLEIRIYN